MPQSSDKKGRGRPRNVALDDAEAEADARAMLLAGGTMPMPDKSAMQQLLDQMPQTESVFMSFAEFIAWTGVPRSTFFRWKNYEPWRLPSITNVGGAKQMIRRVEAKAWLGAQEVIEAPDQPDLVAVGDASMPPRPRKLRVVTSRHQAAAAIDADRPRMFQAPPKKRRGRPPRTAAAAKDAEEPAEPDEGVIVTHYDDAAFRAHLQTAYGMLPIKFHGA